MGWLRHTRHAPIAFSTLAGASCSADAFCRAQFNGTYGNGYEYVGPVQAMETLKLAAGFGDNPCLQQLNHTYLDFAESMANLLYGTAARGAAQ